ncbi:MAG: dihydropteroate synthase [Pseudomonas marincola]
MVAITKGSALPRGLSLSDRVYLAPSEHPDAQSVYTVVIRAGKSVSYFADHSVSEIRQWSLDQNPHEENIQRQMGFLETQKTRRVLGKPINPLIMGIVNVTPDSFSDGGEFESEDAAVTHAKTLTREGADILDFGGESTRPGARSVSNEEELQRVIPVIKRCVGLGPLLSVDTRKAEIMTAALDAGASILNDVTALEYDVGSLKVAASSSAPVCLMHSSADPKVMQDNPQYDHVLFDVIDYLGSRVEACVAAGVSRDNIILDPGIGFGKTLDHNLVLLKGLRFFHGLGCPILLGVSRKSFIGKIDAGEDAKHRIGGSLAGLLYGLKAGVQIFRVHDVREARQAIAVWQSIDSASLTV